MGPDILRRVIGAATLFLGAWLVWRSAHPAWLYIDRGGPVLGTLLDPVFLFPLARGFLAVIGGLLALNALRFAVWFTAMSAGISLLLGALFLAMGQGAVPFVDHFVYAGLLAAASAALIVSKRNEIAA